MVQYILQILLHLNHQDLLLLQILEMHLHLHYLFLHLLM
jgi:hypothetical protein